MRRRLIRLLGATVVFPLTARAAETLADRLELAQGPSAKSRLLRHASRLARRRSGGGRSTRR